MFASLLPKSAPFFEMLLQQNAILCKVMSELLRIFHEYDHRFYANKSLAELEAEADKLHRGITRSLSQTFITPIDREDILRINQGQEECIDRMQSLSIRLTVSDIPRILFPAKKIVENLNGMVSLTTSMLQGLTKRRDCHKTRAFRNLREECDSILSVGLAEVMDVHQQSSEPVDFLNILRWVQIYDRLELILGTLTDLAESIEEAVLKNV